MSYEVGFRLDFDFNRWVVEEPPRRIEFLSKGVALPLEIVLEEVWRADLKHGYKVSARRCGVVALKVSDTMETIITGIDSDRSVEALSEVIRLANVFVLALHFSFRTHNEGPGAFAVTQSSLFRLNGFGFSGGRRAMQETAELTSLSGTIQTNGSVPASAFEYAAQLLGTVQECEYDKSLHLAALLNQALAANDEYDFPLALTLAWTVTEAAQAHLWERATGKSNDRNVRAHSVTEELERLRIFSPSLSGQVNDARRARNDW